jgi:hypothetical protein
MMVLACNLEVVGRLTEKKKRRSHREAEETDAEDENFAESDQSDD